MSSPSQTKRGGHWVEALRLRLQAQAGRPVALVETHISWVLLTPRLAIKLKKPVRLPFLDCSSLAARKHFCEEELRLNRRLAPELYLSVLAVRGSAAAPRLGGGGEVLDYAVCMRRFAAADALDERLAAGRLEPAHLDRLAQRLARFHREAAVAPPTSPYGTAERVPGPVRSVLAQLAQADGEAAVAGLRDWVDAQAAVLAPAWQARREAGFVREVHGDLHLANTVLLGDEATAFDCIEFDPALRWIDVMSDIAFLAMDLKAHGRDDLAFGFLDAYLQDSGDYAGLRVLRFYEVYRALVRALVARLRAAAVPGAPRGADYLACARRLAAPAAAARLLVTHGLSGSGKSTVAAALVRAAGAIRLRSDVERKRLFGLGALERSQGRVGDLYGAEATRRTFERLATLAREALRCGYPVIVDAAFLRRRERAAFAALAQDLHVPFTILHCRAGEGVLRERVVQRTRGGSDASEADLAVLERQLAWREPLDEAERRVALELDTEQPLDATALAAAWLAAATAAKPAPDAPAQGLAGIP